MYKSDRFQTNVTLSSSAQSSWLPGNTASTALFTLAQGYCAAVCLRMQWGYTGFTQWHGRLSQSHLRMGSTCFIISNTVPGHTEQQVGHNIIHGIKGLLCPTEPALPRDDGAVSLDHWPWLSTVRHVFDLVHYVDQRLEGKKWGRWNTWELN